MKQGVATIINTTKHTLRYGDKLYFSCPTTGQFNKNDNIIKMLTESDIYDSGFYDSKFFLEEFNKLYTLSLFYFTVRGQILSNQGVNDDIKFYNAFKNIKDKNNPITNHIELQKDLERTTAYNDDGKKNQYARFIEVVKNLGIESKTSIQELVKNAYKTLPKHQGIVIDSSNIQPGKEFKVYLDFL